ncbi:capsule biosynthesis protein CapZ [Streptomyces sp. P6-2-1]|uniref:capsule biosynthesis protein CapZ n=1 Tax=unclassified Streptomyces TaxID=2593676 RepID=UPI003D35C2F8
MTETVDSAYAAHDADSTEQLRSEIARLDRRIAWLESERATARRAAGALTIDEFLEPIRVRRQAADLRRATGEPRQKVIKVVQPSGMTLPAHSPLRRVPPRKPEDMQPDYLEKYDSHTVFYDVFQSGDDIWLCGPPVSNLKEPLKKADWRVDGTDVGHAVELNDWGRTQRSRITGEGHGRHLTLDLGSTGFSAVIAPDESDLFAGQRTIITKSQDNDLVWIQDYLRYYHVVHGVTGVVFYDNNSTKYTPQDVADAIAQVDGITTAVVVDWAFPFGPNGGPHKVWDSDYCQYGMLEHGHFRYLRKAAGVISTDIDELILTEDARTVFEHAAEAEQGVVAFSGVWMAKATRTPMDPHRQRRFSDYHHRVKGTTTVKWALIPAMVDDQSTQWRIHSVAGAPVANTEKIHHRHFQGVNNGWKYARAETVVTPGTHTYDLRMSRVLDLVFGPSPEGSPTHP